MFFLFRGSLKPYIILLGVALGSLFSHGIAIIFGSRLGLLESENLHQILEIITYASFIIIGILSFIPKNKKIPSEKSLNKGLTEKVSHFKINYLLIIAITIMIGEIGDKTFLASIGFGIEYPNSKIMLILGAICGMVASDSIAILFGKFLNKHISETTMQKISGILFLVFGIMGFCFS